MSEQTKDVIIIGNAHEGPFMKIKQDIPTPWLEEGSSTPHFRASTAGAYKRGEYGDIPNDELMVIQKSLESFMGRYPDDPVHKSILSRVHEISFELVRRTTAAGIELV